mmetsp:Transcript_2536/g.7526  ORF Transcript_2536/g.7526 Transcript_2536/m.7526 type:complete len:257 (+) Transcript_2536:385-1155(+)
MRVSSGAQTIFCIRAATCSNLPSSSRLMKHGTFWRDALTSLRASSAIGSSFFSASSSSCASTTPSSNRRTWLSIDSQSAKINTGIPAHFRRTFSTVAGVTACSGTSSASHSNRDDSTASNGANCTDATVGSDFNDDQTDGAVSETLFRFAKTTTTRPNPRVRGVRFASSSSKSQDGASSHCALSTNTNVLLRSSPASGPRSAANTAASTSNLNAFAMPLKSGSSPQSSESKKPSRSPYLERPPSSPKARTTSPFLV